jgi:hypothetical protein
LKNIRKNIYLRTMLPLPKKFCRHPDVPAGARHDAGVPNKASPPPARLLAALLWRLSSQLLLSGANTASVPITPTPALAAPSAASCGNGAPIDLNFKALAIARE